MPVQVTCACGRTHTLRDDRPGHRQACPTCGAQLAGAAPSSSINPYASPVEPPRSERALPAPVESIFARDRFLLRQQFLSSLAERYTIWDEHGNPLLYVERPRHLLLSIGLALGCFLVGGLVFAGLMVLANLSLGDVDDREVDLIFISLITSFAVAIGLAIALSPKRHITFFRDHSRQDRQLDITQDRRVNLLWATFTLRDANGDELARFEKNHLASTLRRRWQVFDPANKTLCIALEDSALLALLRRFLGSFFGLLRRQFTLYGSDQLTRLGEFNRRQTLLDRYVLDLTDDPERSLDRRIALALGVLLDTGERR